jgi:ABC-type cobalamin/Fe3+-siderophores transport system ATPase subunit
MSDSVLNKALITSLEIPNLNQLGFNAYFEDRKTNNSIDRLNRINIFIGSNNAGKSRLMRSIANNTQRFSYDIEGFDRIPATLSEMQNEFEKDIITKLEGIVDVRRGSGGTSYKLASINFNDYSLTHIQPGQASFESFLKIMNDFLSGEMQVATFRYNNLGRNTIAKIFLNFAEHHKYLVDLAMQLNAPLDPIAVCYIPSLRTLNNFGVGGDERDDFLAKRIRAQYQLLESVDIFTGQSIYRRLQDMLLGDRHDREKVKKYELFLSEKLFDGKDISIIPKMDSDVVDIGIDGDEKRIYELGDGIQALIALTFPLFEYDKGLFFIDEPEVNLHPSMQRKLLEVLQEHTDHQYFLTTHSNHFLDLTIEYSDVSIFLCKKEEKNCEIRPVALGDRSILEEIGAQNTSVFLANKTIWVEGVTDRLYLKKYLELYTDKFNEKPLVEDQDYVFVEYSGGNVTHWSFLDKLKDNSLKLDERISAKRLCGNMVLVADLDEVGSKQERKEILRSELGDRFIELSVREIENLLSPSVLEKVVSEYEKKETEIFNTISQDAYKDALLGKYIDRRFQLKKIEKSRPSYAADSGTIKDKTAFCRKALRHLNNYDDLSLDAQELAKTIYTLCR